MTKPMNRGRVRITAELLSELLKLPCGTKIHGTEWEWTTNSLVVNISSDDFFSVSQGEIPRFYLYEQPPYKQPPSRWRIE